MKLSTFKLQFVLFGVVHLNWLVTTHAFGEANSSASPELQQIWLNASNLSHYSPVHSAGSLGPSGYRLGIGWQRTTQETTHSLDASSAENASMNRLFIERGILPRLTAGAGFGIHGQDRHQALGGHLKFTLFESLLWPAVALRAHYNQLRINSAHKIDNRGYSLLASYGFLRFFKLTFSSNWQFTHARSHIKRDQFALLTSNQLNLDSSASYTQLSQTSYSQFYALGLSVRPWSPFYNIGMEWVGGAQQTSLVKLEYGF